MKYLLRALERILNIHVMSHIHLGKKVYPKWQIVFSTATLPNQLRIPLRSHMV